MTLTCIEGGWHWGANGVFAIINSMELEWHQENFQNKLQRSNALPEVLQWTYINYIKKITCFKGYFKCCKQSPSLPQTFEQWLSMCTFKLLLKGLFAWSFEFSVSLFGKLSVCASLLVWEVIEPHYFGVFMNFLIGKIVLTFMCLHILPWCLY